MQREHRIEHRPTETTGGGETGCRDGRADRANRRTPSSTAQSSLVLPPVRPDRGRVAGVRSIFRRWTDAGERGGGPPLPELAASPDPPPSAPPPSPLPTLVAARVRLSADLLAALLEVEQRQRATLDDLEWADAVADRMLRRRLTRRASTGRSDPAVTTRPPGSPLGAVR
jgi:hypothetical protein